MGSAPFKWSGAHAPAPYFQKDWRYRSRSWRIERRSFTAPFEQKPLYMM